MAETEILEKETDASVESGQEQEMVVKVKGLTKIFKDFWHRPKARAVNDDDDQFVSSPRYAY